MPFSESTRVIAVVLVMKMLSKVVDFQFGCLAPQNFESVNGTCHLKEPVFGSEGTATSWLYAARYMLPVLGGLLASWLGYLVVLQICGYILLLSSALLSFAVLFDYICYSAALVTVAWVFVPLLFSIIHPCVMYCLYRWHNEPRVWTILTGAYMFLLKLGESIALLLPLLRGVVGNYYTLVCVVLSIAFIILTRWLHQEARSVRFVLPTRDRMIRYFKIFSPLILFKISIVDSRTVVYSAEMRHFLSMNTTGTSFVSPELVKIWSQIGLSGLLILVAYCSAKQLPMQPRVYAGILLEATVSASLLIVSIVPPRDVATVRAVFSTASFVDGGAEILVVPVVYEIMNGVAPRSYKLLVFGICFTVWGVTTLIGQALVAIFVAVPQDNPVLRPAPGRMPLFYVYHVIMLLLMILSAAYFHLISFPIAQMLFRPDGETALEDSECEEEAGEATPIMRLEVASRTAFRDRIA